MLLFALFVGVACGVITLNNTAFAQSTGCSGIVLGFNLGSSSQSLYLDTTTGTCSSVASVNNGIAISVSAGEVEILGHSQDGTFISRISANTSDDLTNTSISSTFSGSICTSFPSGDQEGAYKTVLLAPCDNVEITSTITAVKAGVT